MAVDPKLSIRTHRLAGGPIIHAGLDPSIGANIQGPSLICVPDWVPDRLGRYYLYFADHKGSYIRLAFADELVGPWKIYEPGSLQLADTPFLQAKPQLTADEEQAILSRFAEGGVSLLHDPITEVTTPHIASPDVLVDESRQRIVMFYHGLEAPGHQELQRPRMGCVLPPAHPY